MQVPNRQGFGLVALMLTALVLAGLATHARAEGIGYVAGSGFRAGELGVEAKRAFDLGVVDYDGDGILDVFTTNHMFRDSLLRGTGKGRFTDVFHEAGMAPTAAVPGFEDLGKVPEFDEPGIYIYMKANKKRPNIRIRTNDLSSVPGIDGRVEGKISVVFPRVKVKQRSRADVEVRTVAETRTEIDFTARDNARIVLRAHHIDLPFKIEVDKPMPLESVYLGSLAVEPAQRATAVSLGDRHGIAWADFDRDGGTDAFITSGGLSGNINRYRGVLSDELLLSGRDGLVNRTPGSGLKKGNCRGRESLPLDYNRDGRYDLFIGCRDNRPEFYKGRGDGSFKDISNRVRRLGRGGTAYRFVDLDNNGRPELIEGRKEQLRVWRVKGSGRLALSQAVTARNSNKNVDEIAPGDFDNDGDLDLFVASSSDNTLLVNRGGRLDARHPASAGLPANHSFSASWVDFNNDSKLDLHTLPQGLYKGSGKRFRKTGLARTAKGLRFGRASWFDADGDGRRDLALIAQRGTNPFPNVKFSVNDRSRAQRWLELDLLGPQGNRQALGARVSLKAGKRKLHQWVGQNDGARYGQGHYRLYFGLGKKRVAKQVKVIWSDGKRTKLGKVGSNQLLRIRR